MIPFILLNDYSYNDDKYRITIKTILENGDFKSFRVSFGFENEKRVAYPGEIEILKELNFKLNENDFSLEWHSESEDIVYQTVKDLANKLYQLKRQ